MTCTVRLVKGIGSKVRIERINKNAYVSNRIGDFGMEKIWYETRWRPSSSSKEMERRLLRTGIVVRIGCLNENTLRPANFAVAFMLQKLDQKEFTNRRSEPPRPPLIRRLET